MASQLPFRRLRWQPLLTQDGGGIFEDRGGTRSDTWPNGVQRSKVGVILGRNTHQGDKNIGSQKFAFVSGFRVLGSGEQYFGDAKAPPKRCLSAHGEPSNPKPTHKSNVECSQGSKVRFTHGRDIR